MRLKTIIVLNDFNTLDKILYDFDLVLDGSVVVLVLSNDGYSFNLKDCIFGSNDNAKSYFFDLLRLGFKSTREYSKLNMIFDKLILPTGMVPDILCKDRLFEIVLNLKIGVKYFIQIEGVHNYFLNNKAEFIILENDEGYLMQLIRRVCQLQKCQIIRI